MIYLTLLAVAVIGYIIYHKYCAASCKSGPNGETRFAVPRTEKYSDPTGFAYFLYCLKYWLMFSLLTLKQRKYVSKKRARHEQYWTLLQPNQDEHSKESPQRLDLMPNAELANDAIAFQGCDSNGNHILIRFGRRLGGETEVWLIVRLKNQDGSYTKYTLPEHPATTVWGSKKMEYSAGGLRCEISEPMRRWKLSYNGWMRKPDLNGFVHMKFNFIWTALSDEFDFNEQLSPSLTAHSLACERWSREFFKKLTETHEDRYEQWGQMTGLLQVENELPRELVLRGMRDHCYGLRDWRRYRRYTANMGYTSNGTFFHVGAVCIPGGTTHLLYGYVGLPTAEMHPIDQCSIDLSLMGDQQDAQGMHVPPDKFAINFSAAGQSYIIQAQVHTETIVYNGKMWPSKSHLRFYTFALNGKDGGEGFSEFEYRNYPGRPDEKPVPDNLTVFENNASLPQNVQYPAILPLSHRLSAFEQVSGGKGRQLAELSQIQLNFSVPRGLVVTNKAYQTFLEEHESIDLKIVALNNIRWNIEASKELCTVIRKAIEIAPIPRVVVEQISDNVNRFMKPDRHSNGIKFAVRSSAIGEDSDEASSAGQMDTILNVSSSKEAITDSVKKCWASQFSWRAVEYRRQMGQQEGAGCGVVIQEMVPADASGVLFTVDPVTGHPGRLTINANYGLGETVVSGSSDPDVITLTRKYGTDTLKIVNKQLGQKKLVMSIDDESIKEVTVDKSNVCCLSDDQVLQLASVGVQIEKAFGGPRDIEFAFVGDQLHILQARPITTHYVEPDFTLMHEFDSAVMSDNQYSTTANVGEVMGGANYPLGISIAMCSVDKALQYQMMRNGIQDSLHGSFQNCYTIFQNHAMLNLSQTLYKDPAVISDRYVSEMCVLGHPVEDPKLSEILAKVLADYSKPKRLINFAKVMKMMYTAYDLTGDIEKETDGFKLPGFYTKPEDIYHTLNAAMKQYCKAWRCHVASSGYSGFWYHLLVAILAKGKHDWSPESYADIALLYSNCEDVISADVPAALQELAKAIAEGSLQLQNFCSLSSKDALSLLLGLPAKDPARRGFETLLERHGHRCNKEIGFLENSWGEEPQKLIPIIQTIVTTYKSGSVKTSNRLTAHESIDQLKTPLTTVQRKILEWAVPKARKAVSNREHTKSMAIKVGNALRLGYRKLSHVLLTKGVLPDSELLYYLTHHEIGLLIEHRERGRLIHLATRRRRLHQQLEKTSLDDIVIGYPKDIGHQSIHVGSLLEGTPVSSGRVEGRVRVAKTLEDASLLQKGEILVTHSTDIAWSVFFPVIGGVVTELGGLLSHGAVVAREYGLPCLVSVKNATDFFITGDQVVLNGSAGTITKLN